MEGTVDFTAMIACFGLYDGYHESCFPADRLVENRLRLDAFKLNRIGAFAEEAVTRLKWGRPRGCLLARQAPNILINGNPVLVGWDEQGRRFECTACGRWVTLTL
jgi:hypothetical protein